MRKIFGKISQLRTLSSSSLSINNSNKLLSNPSAIKMGWSKDFIASLAPLTAEVILTRGRAYENLAIGYFNQHEVEFLDNGLNSSGKDPSKGKRRTDDSWLQILLPFTDHPQLRESLTSCDNSSIRYGKLFEILDSLAGDIAYRHCNYTSKEDLIIVTASLEGMRMTTKLNVNMDLKLQGYITYIGRSSMEIIVDIITITSDGYENMVGNAKFTMAARDRSGKSKEICGLLLNNEAAKERYEIGKNNVLLRQKNAATSLSLTPPKPQEIDIIHSLFLQSKQFKLQKDFIIQSFSTNNNNNKLKSTNTSSNDNNNILEYNDTKRFEWMKNTIQKSAHIMFPQHRNIHGKVFGGYILKEAFEIAYTTALCFVKSVCNPLIIYVDEIQFVKPVNVGSVMEFTGSVIYSYNNNIVVRINVMEIGKLNNSHNKTNIMTYIFQMNDNNNKFIVPSVMPKEYDDMVLYLEGKRSLDKLMIENNNNDEK